MLLTRGAVAAILAACDNARYRTLLTVCDGCGLRLSEVLALRVKDIDGERHLLRVTQGKGAKDRLVPLSPTLLAALRDYWRQYRPDDWLFAGRAGTPLSPTGLQKAFTAAKRRARRDHGRRDSWAAPRLRHPSIGGRFVGGAPATPDGPSQHPDHPALCALAA
jgi:integrase